MRANRNLDSASAKEAVWLRSDEPRTPEDVPNLAMLPQPDRRTDQTQMLGPMLSFRSSPGSPGDGSARDIGKVWP